MNAPPVHLPRVAVLPARRPSAWLLRAIGLGLACLAAAAIGHAIAPPTGQMPMWGLAGGVALVALVRWGLAYWPAVAVAAVAVVAGAFGDVLPLWPALGVAAGAVLAPCLAAAALAYLDFDRHLQRRRDLGWLVALIALAALVCTVNLQLWLAHAAVQDWPQTLRGLPSTWLANALGMLAISVPMLTLDREALRAPFAPMRWPATVLLLLGVLGSVVGVFALADQGAIALTALACLNGALLAVLVLRSGIAVASASVLLVAAGLGLTAVWAGGQSALPWPFQDSAALWAAVATLVIICLLVHTLTHDLVTVERRWLLALGGAGLGVAEWRTGRDKGRTSSHWRSLMGSPTVSWSGWLTQLHPEDQDELQGMLRRLNDGAQQRERMELRARVDDTWRWLELQLIAVERHRQGRISRLLATLSDISERHDAQQRQRLSSSVFEHLHEGLLIADAQMRVVDVNPAYTQILGMSRASLVGTVPSLLQTALRDPLVRQQRLLMWSSLRETGRWYGEVEERRHNGEPCTLRLTISTIDDAAQTLQYHVLVISDITEQRQQRDRLERQANFDELTRLPNRARVQELLAEAMRMADDEGFLLTVCYLDLDRFKPINDRFGHAAGDRLLVELAGRLRSALRSAHVWSDAAGRLGGDEFVLLLRASTLDEARMAVERVLRVVEQPYVLDPQLDSVQVTASIGATVYPDDNSDADTLMRHADHAMYDAKQAGRNGYKFFDAEHRRRTEERVIALGRVQEALDQHEFVLHYQPKVDMRRGVVLGLEALVRWQHPQRGLLAPSQFLPLIEGTGLLARLGDWVLGQGLEHLAGWRRAGFDISVSVNVSARHFQEVDFALRLSELLARHAEPLAPHLELEMLESAAHADIQATSALLAHCRSLGVR
ncbi:MAG: diguanylate cyclase, partial [Rubrivivax sp.]